MFKCESFPLEAHMSPSAQSHGSEASVDVLSAGGGVETRNRGVDDDVMSGAGRATGGENRSGGAPFKGR